MENFDRKNRSITMPLNAKEEERTGDDRLILVVDDQNRVHVATPPGGRTGHEQTFDSRRSSVFWHIAETNGSVVEGFTVGEKVFYYNLLVHATCHFDTFDRQEKIMGQSKCGSYLWEPQGSRRK